jgi:hypothetical protein
LAGWRDEVDVVLREWIANEGGGKDGRRWQRVGATQAGSQPGQFIVDARSAKLTADLADDLRLATQDGNNILAEGFPVMDVTFEKEVLRLRVPEHAPPGLHLWWHRQEPAFLLKSLREKIAGLTDAGLANRLADGDLGGVPSAVSCPAWLKNGQENAYRACLGEGLFLVWGPPGTGKTRVLRSAIGTLLREGKRVLLVSGTNIAVDNALHETLKEGDFRQGQIVRVGPPQLTEIANNPDVSLPLMIRAKVAHVEQARRAAAEELRRMNSRQQRLESLDAQLAGFDVDIYNRAVALLNQPGGSVAELTAALASCGEAADRGAQELDNARVTRDRALADVTEAEPVRRYWEEADQWAEAQARVEQNATWAQARELGAEQKAGDAQWQVNQLVEPNGKVRRRNRAAHALAQQTLDARLRELVEARAARANADRVATAAQLDAERQISLLTAQAPLSREEIQRRDDALSLAESQAQASEQRQRELLTEQARLTDALAGARAAEELFGDCCQRGWPELHNEARDLRGATARDSASRRDVQERHDELQKQYEAMEKDAQGEIISAARLVATTLARFRINKSVFDGQYDVVLIDEVGAASLPEVLLAVAKAGRCAVLLGDFMQLGPVLPSGLERSERPEIKKWLLTDVFRHCSIATLEDARRHPSCLVLDTQHRFGPDVMELANRIAYAGLLKAGPGVRDHGEEDPELVLIDTDGLGELAEIQRDGGKVAGWWPAGLLLSRMLVQMHRENGEEVGVVTPYAVQATATLEGLRDVEPGGIPLAEVGTAHKFQGREFAVVVFDTVETQLGRAGWVAQATLGNGDGWHRDGVRLFNVAATRVKHRLYVIASRERVLKAGSGTALGHFGAMLRKQRVRRVVAGNLITPLAWDPKPLGPESTALASVLAKHIEVTDINDEVSFYPHLTSLIDAAKVSIWLWSPWVAKRCYQVLPKLKAAIERNVKIVVFTRDPSDKGQGRDDSAQAIKALRDIGVRIVEMNVAHQKVVVIDDHTVMMGSLNALSQHRTREVMLTTNGTYFARKLLAELHAEEFSTPPPCGACGGDQVDLRRRTGRTTDYHWRCYNKACPDHGKGRDRAWTQKVALKR